MNNEAQGTGMSIIEVDEKRDEKSETYERDSGRIDPFTKRPKPSDIIDFDIGAFSRQGSYDFEEEVLPIRVSSDARIHDEDLYELAEAAVRIVNLAVINETDTIFFLDKSARPLAFLFLSLWNNMYPEFRPPHVRFIDIGTNTTWSDISEEAVAEVRKRYGSLRGHKCIVADEVLASGGTLVKAKSIMKKIYPHNHMIYTVAFCKKTPDWYRSKLYTGVLGVEDPKEDSFIASVSPKASEYRLIRSNKHQFRRELILLGKILAQYSHLRRRKSRDNIRPLLKSVVLDGTVPDIVRHINE